MCAVTAGGKPSGLVTCGQVEMGSKSSSLRAIPSNQFLRKYVGNESIQPTDPFWQEFLGFSWLNPSDYNAVENFEELDGSLLREFRKHNIKTHQLSSLMQFVIARAYELIGSVRTDPKVQFDTKILGTVQNGLLVFRISARYLLEHTTEQNFQRHLTDCYESSNRIPKEVFLPVLTSSSLLECFFQVLFSLLLKVPVNEETYSLHCETIMSALVLLARQMHRDLSSPLPLVFAYVMWGKCASLAPVIVHRLMTNFAENLPAPPGILGRTRPSSFVWRAASSLAGGLLTVITLGYANRGGSSSATVSSSVENGERPPVPPEPVTDLITSEPSVRTEEGCNVLAELSSLLLLVLTTQAGSILKCSALLQELGLNPQTPSLNPYRIALFSLRGKHEKLPIPPSGVEIEGEMNKGTPKAQPGGCQTQGNFDFAAIRDITAATLHQDSSTLLLYLLIHRNPFFHKFVIQDRNYEKLLIPLLNILYRSPSDSSHLVYMALIIILILTESEQFDQEIHTSIINWVNWSPNRRLSSVTRGSLIVLVLVRTIRYHLNQLRDKYLHVNILAALANLSSRITSMHPHVSESLLGLLHLLTKRYNRNVEHLRVLSLAHDKERLSKQAAEAQQTNATVQPKLSEDALVQELALLEEVIRMILEILNSILTHCLEANSNLVYSLLYKRDCLTALRSHPSFQGVVQNLDTILTFFSTKIDKELGENLSSPASLLAVIEKNSPVVYRVCNLRKFPDLKFKYVEEESPDDFFIPYVWSVVLRESSISFRTDSLPLFNPDRTAQPSEKCSDAEDEDEKTAFEPSPLQTSNDVGKEPAPVQSVST
ncbi:unnamed protein product [Calicophoron daubneyi]|uniref:Dymeclin n=1 Tax=Calicophoron daubneyi TaxID=300641 RepID=A0AAV2TXD9_CALDB